MSIYARIAGSTYSSFPIHELFRRSFPASFTSTNMLGNEDLLSAAPLLPALEKLSSFESYGANWDGNNSPRPDRASIDATKDFLKLVHASISNNSIPFTCPFITPNEYGEIALEWWRHEKKLTVYIASNEIRYIKSWGTNIFSDMEDGTMRGGDIPLLWNWLSAA